MSTSSPDEAAFCVILLSILAFLYEKVEAILCGNSSEHPILALSEVDIIKVYDEWRSQFQSNLIIVPLRQNSARYD